MAYTRTNWRESETALSAENMNNIEDGIEEALMNAKGNQELWAFIRNLVYPVGSIYMSTDSTNPSARFGGTWVAWGSGKVPVGVNASDTNFNTVEKTGGSKDAVAVTHNHTATFSGNAVSGHTHTGPSHTHTGPSHTHTGPSHAHVLASHGHDISAHYHDVSLTSNSSGEHSHSMCDLWSDGTASPGGNAYVTQSGRKVRIRYTVSSGAHTHFVAGNTGSKSLTTKKSGDLTTSAAGTGATSAAGTGATSAAGTGNTSSAGGHTPSGSVSVANGGQSGANKNLQPYITCYMWKRTA